MSKSKKQFALAAIGAAALMIQSPAHAALVTLTNNNSSISLNTHHDPNPIPGNLDGIYNWTVDGVNQIREQEFFIRTASTGGATRVTNLTPTGVTQTANFLLLTYQGSGYNVAVNYLLTGGTPGSKTSDIAETLTITNSSSTNPLSVQLIDLVDENLGGQYAHDSATITGGNTATQTSPTGYIGGTVVTPTPSRFEVGTYNPLQTGLDSGLSLPLNDNATVTNKDVAFAFEYDKTLSAGQSYSISSDMQLTAVPEPTTAAAMLGVGALFMRRNRRRA